MGMIIWPGEMEFWEQREAAQKQLREERERRVKQDAEWWRLLQQHQRQPQHHAPLTAIRKHSARTKIH